MEEPIIEAVASLYDTSNISLPTSMYIGSGLEHQFAIELYMANKDEMVLKVLDSATPDTYSNAPYYVYLQTNDGLYIDPHGIYDNEEDLLQKYRMRLFRANRPVPSRLTQPKVVAFENLENWRLKRFLTNTWWSEDPEMKNTDIMEVDGWMEWFDDTLEGDGPIDEDLNQQDPFELDSDDVFDIKQSDSEICMSCGELASQCMQDGMQYGCRNYNKKKSKKPYCPCGCEGDVTEHDDRSMGQWPCPTCGDDSDTDMLMQCSDCAKGKKRPYDSRLTKRAKSKALFPTIMRGYNHGTNNEKRGEWLNPRHKNDRMRNIDGTRFQMLVAGGSGGSGSAYASQGTMRKRADSLRKKGYNARVIPMAGNKDGKYALFITKKVRFSDTERRKLEAKGINWMQLEKSNRR